MKPILVVILSAAVFLLAVQNDTVGKAPAFNLKPVKMMPLKQKIYLLRAAKEWGRKIYLNDEIFLHEAFLFFRQ